MKNNAFTLIELLVVVAIIGILSSVVLASLSGAREDARESAAKGDLNAYRTAIELMLTDTGAWPGGCTPQREVNPDNKNVALRFADSPKQAGLTERPEVGDVPGFGDFSDPCSWSQREVNAWDGPYIQSNKLTDPWGRSYIYDTRVIQYDACEGDIFPRGAHSFL